MLDAERKERVKGCPGARLSRSALMRDIFQTHRARKAVA